VDGGGASSRRPRLPGLRRLAPIHAPFLHHRPAAVEAARGKYIVALFSGVCVKLALFLAGALLLCGLVRLWRGLSLPTLGAYGLLVLGFFAVPLCTPALQVPTDIAYQWRPWSAALAAPVRPRNPLLADVPLQMLPFHDLVRKRLLAGEMPLWASELGTGQPLLGNAQSAPFAPLHLMALPLAPPQALTVAVAWQVLVALLLMHALLEALGAGRAGAAFGAVAYALSVFEICWAYHPHGMAMAWIPGVLLSIVLVRRGEAGGMAGLVACGLGLLLSGHPETAATAALVSLAAAGVLAARPGGVSRRAFVLELGLAAGMTACLAAPALLPVLDAIRDDRQALPQVGVLADPARAVDVAGARLDQRPLERVDQPRLLGCIGGRHGGLPSSVL